MTTLINEKIKQFFIINILGMSIYELTLKLFFKLFAFIFYGANIAFICKFVFVFI